MRYFTLYKQLLRAWVCLYKVNPWFKFSIRFNWYGKRSFQRALWSFISLWFYLMFRKFNYASMFKMPGLPLQIEGWTKCLGVYIFCHTWGNYIFFSLSLFSKNEFSFEYWHLFILSQLLISRIELSNFVPSRKLWLYHIS